MRYDFRVFGINKDTLEEVFTDISVYAKDEENKQEQIKIALNLCACWVKNQPGFPFLEEGKVIVKRLQPLNEQQEVKSSFDKIYKKLYAG